MVTFPFLESLTAQEAESLLSRLPTREYCNSELIFETGEDSSDIYFILQGGTKSMVMGVDGQVAFFRQRTAGEVMGYYSALTGEKRTANMVAVGKTKLAKMKCKDFMDLVTTNPSISRYMLALLASLLREETKRVSGMVTMTSKEHVCSLILMMLGSQQNTCVSIPARSEFASYAGISRETLSRILNDLVREGAITLDKDSITVLDKDKLSQN